MKLVILTRDPSWRWYITGEFVRYVLRKITGRVRGPQQVTRSLLAGLTELKISFLFNPRARNIPSDALVYVNESLGALAWAIAAKKTGHIKGLWAGPALTVLPSEADGIVGDVAIDGLLCPSAWTKDLWVSLRPDLAKKIYIWPAGIAVKPLANVPRTHCIVYQKNAPDVVLAQVLLVLEKEGKPVRLLRYGHYTQSEYMTALDQADSLIYLSESESQGMALLEAWERNVPTLVWCRGYWQYRGEIWYDAAVSAPYLTPECGLFFQGTEDFLNRWRIFSAQKKMFKPRSIVERRFTHAVSTQLFLDYVNAFDCAKNKNG